MWRAAARNVKKAPSRLTFSTRRHSSLLISRNEARAAPAHAGVGEAAVDAAERADRLGEGSLDRRLVRRRRTRAPGPCARWLGQLGFRGGVLRRRWCPRSPTSAPAWAIARAMPRPMPLLPPVTRATLPVRSKGLYIGLLAGCAVRCRKSCAFRARRRGGMRAQSGASQTKRQRRGPLPLRISPDRWAPALELVRHALLLGRQVALVVGRGRDDQRQLLDRPRRLPRARLRPWPDCWSAA